MKFVEFVREEGGKVPPTPPAVVGLGPPEPRQERSLMKITRPGESKPTVLVVNPEKGELERRDEDGELVGVWSFWP